MLLWDRDRCRFVEAGQSYKLYLFIYYYANLVDDVLIGKQLGTIPDDGL